MKKLIPLCLLIAAAGCMKPDDPTAVPTLPGSGCGSDGHRIQLTIDDADWCANANIAAIASPDGELIVNGLAITGQLFGLQIDSIGLGTFPMDEVNNAAVWSEGGTTFTSTNDNPGTLQVLTLDAVDHTITGTFQVVVSDAENPSSRELSGAFDLTYTVE